MSQSNVAIQQIESVVPHPNADRLEIAMVSGYLVVVPKGEFKAGDFGVYFPPDNLIPQDVADALGVAKYLKHAVYPGDSGASQCRIGAARIRGQASFGFIIKTENDEVGLDLNGVYRVHRYEPPVKLDGGKMRTSEHPKFYRYFNIENIQRARNLIQPGTPVAITEKLHGSNCRIGVIDGGIVAGSHKTQLEYRDGSLYWTPYNQCRQLLEDMKEDEVDIIIFGEVIGPGVQDLKYGVASPEFRCFDIMVAGEYVDFFVWKHLCRTYEINMVPVLYTGPFSMEKVVELTDGKSTLAEHIREGVVIRSILETHPRQIVKSVSVDYLARD